MRPRLELTCLARWIAPVLVVLASAVADGAVLVRGPYLQSAAPQSVRILWRTDVATDSRVRVGSSPEALALVYDEATPTTEHAVLVDGLAPETLYYYSVGSSALTLAGGDALHWFVTPPPSGAPRPARVWVVGDSGTADANAEAVRDAYRSFTGATRTDLWLMLGDNAYPDGTDAEYQLAVFETYPEMLRNAPLWPTFGNHDGRSASSLDESGPYYDVFSLPRLGEAGGIASGTEAFYSFDYANVHFVSLNSHDVDRSASGAMATWLSADLAASTQDWVIAFWHHPPYSKGSHDSDEEERLAEMRENTLPILEDAGVDLVLSGHSHSYERSVLLGGHYGDSRRSLQPVMVKDAGDGSPMASGSYEKSSLRAGHEGTVYVVAGSSGKITSAPLDHPVMLLGTETLGSLVLDFDGLALDVTFLDDLGVVVDDFRIEKALGGLPSAPADLVGTAFDGGQIDLRWSDTAARESGFVVERSLDGSLWSEIATLGETELYSDAGLAPDTTHHYRVRAWNGVGDSEPSPSVSVTTPGPEVESFVAAEERSVAGRQVGDRFDASSLDGVAELLVEDESGGAPERRFSELDHRWRFDLSGPGDFTLLFEGHAPLSTDGDRFELAWSTDDQSYTPLLEILETTATPGYVSAPLPPDLSGPVWIRVADSDHTEGNLALDRVFVEQLAIRRVPEPTGTLAFLLGSLWVVALRRRVPRSAARPQGVRSRQRT